MEFTRKTYLQGSTSATQEDCPAGGFCDGQFFYPCPAGTYNSQESKFFVILSEL